MWQWPRSEFVKTRRYSMLKNKRISPTALTLRRLRAAGYTAAVVEHWNPHAGIRQDLWGFADVAAVRADQVGILFVQCCIRSALATRVNKIKANQVHVELLKAGNRIEAWGWKKLGGRWNLEIRSIVL
jgi:hypothetical protein